MKLPRRAFLQLAAGAAALPAMPRISWAQAYPTRPVRIIVGFPAGSGPDITARLMGQGLSERLGQQCVIENRLGAGGNIATEAVVRSPPDGYTLLLVNASNTINATLYTNLNFNLIRDVTPVTGIGHSSYGMLVNQSFPVKTVPEFIAYAKSNTGKINMASAGSGSGPDLLSGQVQVAFAPMTSSTGYIRAGTLRALADRRDAFGGSAEHPDRRRVRAGI